MDSAAVGTKRARADVVEFDKETFQSTHGLDDDTFILGIDEAGRGSVVGHMVYGGAVVALRDHDALVKTGAFDSKQLTPEARCSIRTLLRTTVPSFTPFVKEVTANEISESMFGRRGKNLNTLSHDCAIGIIQEAIIHCKGKLAAVYVDTVGIAEVYEKMLKGRFPHLMVTVASKADAKYPIVSAASIMAKTHRDDIVHPSVFPGGINVGTGYPSDPNAMAFVRTKLHRFFGYRAEYSSEVRHSWRPVADVVKEQCVAMTFEQDLDKEQLFARSNKLSFERAPPARDTLFGHVFGLKSCQKLSFQ